MRDEFQRILGETATNLVDTGVALEQVVTLYESTDAAAAAVLRRLIGDRASHPDLDQPVNGTFPDPRMPA